MAKLSMKVVEIITLQQDGKELLESLQRSGVMELTRVDDCRLTGINTKSGVIRLEKHIAAVEEALQILNEIVPPTAGVMAMFNGRTPVDSDAYREIVSDADDCLKVALAIQSARRRIDEAKAETVKCQAALDALTPWLALDLPMQFAGTEQTATFVGTFSRLTDREEILSELAVRCPEQDAVDVDIISATKEQTAVFVVCSKEAREPVLTAFREMGLVAPSDPTRHPPRVRQQRNEERLAVLNETIEKETAFITEHATWRTKLQYSLDYFSIKREEYAAQENAELSEQTIVLRGYVPACRVESVAELIRPFAATMTVEEPDESDENVPVLLKNNGFVTPVESVTEMYSLPGKADIDPSSIMAFFYYLLFGMMLSDAGYGVVMTLGTWLILKKTTVEGNLRRSLKMFFYCGISTTVWGALFGSWFGDIVPLFCQHFLNRPAPNLALWFEPIKDPIKLLLFSFAIGICHLFLGLITAGVMQWKKGNRWDAVFDTVPVMLMVLGAAPLGAGIMISTVPPILSTIGSYMALAGAVLIVLTSARSSKNIFARLGGGLYGLYNAASGYLSDILSYSRLLALGLATGSIAGVINMIGVMPENKILKGILLVIVFIFGHALNMAINVLGAYVHTNRLQFVELFSKFYEGGGRAFSPLKITTKYFKFKEDS